jgi:hypothetical protein
VPGARPDIVTLYGTQYGDAGRASWGYMLLTQGLWNQGNGTFKLYAFGFDRTGAFSTLGTKTITIDNANATKPFGSIDTPSYGGTASGVVTNFGWALTPGATCTITNSNVQVSVDSGPLTPVVYGDVRPDVAAAFPGYTNAPAAGAHYTLDTTTLTNGMHTIGWIVTDSCGRADGIGSRFFTVANGGSALTAAPAASIAAVADGERRDWMVVRGTSSDAPPATADGTRVVRIAEGERIELQLPGNAPYAARQLVNGSPRDLPLGSSFDAPGGKFYWQPAAGFLGAYDLEFTGDARTERVRAVVGPPIRMAIDTPGAGNVLSASGFTIAGWAVDLASLEGARDRRAARVGLSRERRRRDLRRRRERRRPAARCRLALRFGLRRRRLQGVRFTAARHLRPRRLCAQRCYEPLRWRRGCQGCREIGRPPSRLTLILASAHPTPVSR